MKLYESKHWMRESCPGLTNRLKFTSLLMMAFVFMTFGSAAQAQFHGASIQKQCTNPVRNCLDDADCSNDDNNLCTPEICDTDLAPRTSNCNIRATNADENGDTVTVSEAFDTITTAAGDVRTPVGSGNLLVSAVGGSTTCAVGDPLPCTLNTIGSFVEFNVQYTLMEADNDLVDLDDQGTVTWIDNCDDPDTTNCSDVDNTVQAPASTTVLDACSTGEEVDCDDGNACTIDSCNPDTGECEFGDPTVCDDGNACTVDSCNTDTGECEFGDPTVCDDGDVCTDDSCNTDTGVCESVDNGTCEAICRTPGFWGVRGGNEKNGENITDYFIMGGFEVCGVPITNTNLNDPNSAIEAICINKSDVGDRKIIRNLTSAMLNCNTSVCSTEIQTLIAECNQLCADGQDYGTCAGELDCYNNGDTWDYDLGMCIENFGACFVSGEDCSDSVGCGDDDYCVPEENCHDRMLCPEGGDYCFEPPGPASSSGKCNKARKNSLYIGE